MIRGALAPLTLAECGACEGEGYRLVCAGTPVETHLICVTCGGEGRLEVCEGCGEVPRVVRGLELCNCVAEGVALAVAA